MLTVHHLSKSFDSQILFHSITFSLNPGERVGLVGANGCGKTTLLRILAGEETASNGHVRCSPSLRIGYLAQGFEPEPEQSIAEILGQRTDSAETLFEELEILAEKMVLQPTDTNLQAQYDRLINRIAAAETGRAARILSGLGLDGIEPSTPAGHLSGGQKTRLALALLLLAEPDILLLDEPTNHLDIEMLEWLETWLIESPCAVLIVSHDRAFLDATVTRILEMDTRRGMHEYSGNYSSYFEQRQAEIEHQWTAFQDQQEEIQRMKEDIARVKAQAAYTERQASSIRIGGPDMKIKGFKSYQQGIAKKVARKAKSRETKLEHYLEAEERVERPQRSWQIKMEFEKTAHLGQTVLYTEDLSVGYAGNKPLLHHLNLGLNAGQRVVLTGPNGSGKTTFIRTLAGQIPPLGGTFHLGSSTRMGYMSQDQSSLMSSQSALEHIAPYYGNETRARNFLAYYLFHGDESLKPVQLLSYGQRSRLMLAILVAHGCNLLLLDEPVNHLDIPSRTQFESALTAFEGTVLAVVHDRYFIERFAQEIWWVENGGITIHGLG